MNRDPNREFVAKKRVDSSLINFISFMAGLVTAIMLLLLVWNQFFGTSPERPVVAAPVPEKNTIPREKLTRSNFRSVVGVARADDLEPLLVQFNNWNRTADLAVRISENEDRIEVANAMLQLQLNESQRELAVIGKLEALSAIYGMKFLHKIADQATGPELKTMGLAYAEDANPSIALTARLSVLKIDTFEFIKDDQATDLGQVLDQMLELIRQNPESELVISNIKLLLMSLRDFRREDGMSAMRELMNHRAEFVGPHVEELFGFISDSLTLEESRLEEMFQNRWIHGATGQQQLAASAASLARRSTTGKTIVEKLQAIANWFEQENRYEEAMAIYSGLIRSADDRPPGRLREMTRALGRQGQTRCQLPGQRIEFEDLNLNGTLVSHQTLEDRIGVIIFWSRLQPDSIASLLDFHKYSEELASKQVVVLAVCLDDRVDDSLVALARKIPRFQVVVKNPDPSGAIRSIAKICPVTTVPHCLMINHHGRVHDVNVPSKEMKSTVSLLITQRFDK